MKKLKNFQKFALSAEQINSVRGGAVGDGTVVITCWVSTSSGDIPLVEFEGEGAGSAAANYCAGESRCVGCF